MPHIQVQPDRITANLVGLDPSSGPIKEPKLRAATIRQSDKALHNVSHGVRIADAFVNLTDEVEIHAIETEVDERRSATSSPWR